MTTGLFEANFYETYYVANIISSILKEPFPYVRKFDEYFGDDKIQYYISGFPKKTIFHVFIEKVIEDLWYDQLDKHINSNNEILIEPPIITILKYHKADYLPFNNFVASYQKENNIMFMMISTTSTTPSFEVTTTLVE